MHKARSGNTKRLTEHLTAATYYAVNALQDVGLISGKRVLEPYLCLVHSSVVGKAGSHKGSNEQARPSAKDPATQQPPQARPAVALSAVSTRWRHSPRALCPSHSKGNLLL